VCARPAVPANVYQIVAGRSFHGTTAGRAFTSVGYSKNQDQNRVADASSMRNVGLQISRRPRHDRLAGRHREEGPSRRLAAAVAPRLDQGAHAGGFPAPAGQSPAAAVRPGSAHGTNQSHLSSVQLGHGRFVNAKFDRAGVQDPAAGAAHGGDIGSEKDQHVREGFLNAGIVGTP
jgi:hypothetical protein